MWLIFLLVVFITAFPPAFAAINVVLFIPLLLAVIGIVLRGSSFVFKTHGSIQRNRNVKILSRTFSVASIMTPFFLALAAAAPERAAAGAAMSGDAKRSGATSAAVNMSIFIAALQ